jgi:hypothetical protein
MAVLDARQIVNTTRGEPATTSLAEASLLSFASVSAAASFRVVGVWSLQKRRDGEAAKKHEPCRQSRAPQ